MMVRPLAFLMFVSVPLSFGVPAAGVRAQQASIRDSAGTRIVTNPEMPQHEITRADRPAFDLLITPERTETNGRGRSLGFGGIGGAPLVVYSPSGWWVFDVPRPAGVPLAVAPDSLPSGGASWFAPLTGDTVAMYSAGRRVVFLLDRRGRAVDSFRVPRVRQRWGVDASGVFRDGSVLFMSPAGRVNDGWAPAPDSVLGLRISRGGETVGSVGPFGNGWSFGAVVQSPNRVQVYPGTHAAFEPEVHVRVRHDRIYVGDGSTFEIRVHAASGALEQIIRLRHQPVAVTDSDRASFGEAAGPLGDAQLDFARVTHPAFSRIEVDDTGRVWVRDSALADGRQRWVAFDAVGVAIGVLHLPGSASVMEFRSNEVLLSDIDASGERVRAFPLSIPEPGGR